MAAESEQETAAGSKPGNAAESEKATAAASEQKTSDCRKEAEEKDEFDDFEDYLVEIKAEREDPRLNEEEASSEDGEIGAKAEPVAVPVINEEAISPNQDIAMEVNAAPKNPQINEEEGTSSNHSLTFGELEPATTSDWNFCMTLLNDLSKMNEQQKVSFRVKIEQMREATLKEFVETE